MQRSVVSSAIFAVSALFGCSDTISPPVCRATTPAIDRVAPENMCLLMQRNQAILFADSDNRLFAPAIPDKGKDTACSLHHQVWQMSGINVEVSDLVYSSATTHIFACHLPTNLTLTSTPLTLATWQQNSAAESLQVVDLYALERQHLRNEGNLVPLREAFVTALGKVNAQE